VWLVHRATACGRGSGFANSVPKPRQSRTALVNPEAPYPVWKANAVNALQRLHERAAAVTRESIGHGPTFCGSIPLRLRNWPFVNTTARTRLPGSRGGDNLNRMEPLQIVFCVVLGVGVVSIAAAAWALWRWR
jgi:hypothetical protein